MGKTQLVRRILRTLRMGHLGSFDLDDRHHAAFFTALLRHVAKTPRFGDTFGLIPTSFWNIGSYSSISEITKQRIILAFCFFSNSTLTRKVSLGVCVFEGFLNDFFMFNETNQRQLGTASP